MPQTAPRCHGALAMELVPGSTPGRKVADLASAEALAALVAKDLARQVPQAARLDLGLACGLFDPAELLRPGFPLHSELERLLQLAPATGAARIVAFAAHAGELPPGLRAEPGFAGPMRLLPFVLRGDAATMIEASEAMEAVLLDTGMAGAGTALLAQQVFGAAIEHARYLTVHDLAAMTAMHYEHAGLAPLWPLIETALLSPQGEQWLDAAPEPILRYAAGEARIALLDADAWLMGGFAPADLDGNRLERAFERFQMRQRQFALVLEAHGIDVLYAHCPQGQDVRTVLRS
jgi:hypothetical protein